MDTTEREGIAMPLELMLVHDRDRIARFTLSSGHAIPVREVLEHGEGWLLVLSGYGESEEKQYVRTSAIVAAALR